MVSDFSHVFSDFYEKIQTLVLLLRTLTSVENRSSKKWRDENFKLCPQYPSICVEKHIWTFLSLRLVSFGHNLGDFRTFLDYVILKNYGAKPDQTSLVLQ